MVKLGGWISRALREREDEAALAAIRDEVEAFCTGFPVPGIES
jgi:glycine/serine hydroxymethyltransferase